MDWRQSNKSAPLFDTELERARPDSPERPDRRYMTIDGQSPLEERELEQRYLCDCLECAACGQDFAAVTSFRDLLISTRS